MTRTTVTAADFQRGDKFSVPGRGRATTFTVQAVARSGDKVSVSVSNRDGWTTRTFDADQTFAVTR